MNKQERQAFIAECRASGMTAKAWCEAKGIEYQRHVGWATKVNQEFNMDPFGNYLFLFCNKHRNRLKCLNWEITPNPGTLLISCRGWLLSMHLFVKRLQWLQAEIVQSLIDAINVVDFPLKSKLDY